MGNLVVKSFEGKGTTERSVKYWLEDTQSKRIVFSIKVRPLRYDYYLLFTSTLPPQEVLARIDDCITYYQTGFESLESLDGSLVNDKRAQQVLGTPTWGGMELFTHESISKESRVLLIPWQERPYTWEQVKKALKEADHVLEYVSISSPGIGFGFIPTEHYPVTVESTLADIDGLVTLCQSACHYPISKDDLESLIHKSFAEFTR